MTLAVHAFETFLREHRVDTLFEEPVAPHTSMKIGGPAEYFIRPRDESELAEVVRRARENDVPFRVLGSGANLLVRDEGVRGAVLHLKHFHRREFADTLVKVQAGYNLAHLVKECPGQGLSGLEPLAGVPASVGGAIAMNAGTRHGEIGAVVKYADVMDLEGNVSRIVREQIEFRYRFCSLRGAIVLGAGLQLAEGDPGEVEARYQAIMADKKGSQPLGSPNAGCVFKNPPGGRAGKMIDECGLKGTRIGRAHISNKHANFIINEGGASAEDVLRLVDLVRARVRERFESILELEILVW